MLNTDELIYKARTNLSIKFSEEFKKKNIKKMAEILKDREQILDGNIKVAKKYL